MIAVEWAMDSTDLESYDDISKILYYIWTSALECELPPLINNNNI
jgi:hypothetical protein